eukprot:NODE_337_length_10662_cov_0.497207.p4 type:complete len:260 gc:universal NODE_337_length_10662_cov_0.497207:3832-4611(+)
MWLIVSDIRMLLYHPFYFAFAYGMILVNSITSLIINWSSIRFFGPTKTQYMLITLDVLMITTASVVRWAPKTNITWIFLVFSTATYAHIFTVYFFFRCYKLLSKKMQSFGYIIYTAFYFVLLAFFAGTFGFISTFTSAFILLSAMPILSVYTNSLLITIIRMIRENPLHSTSGKQTRLMLISYYTMLFVNLFAMSSGVVGLIGAFLENSELFAISIALNSSISFIYAISSGSMMANRYLDDKVIFISNSAIFITKLIVN